MKSYKVTAARIPDYKRFMKVILATSYDNALRQAVKELAVSQQDWTILDVTEA